MISHELVVGTNPKNSFASFLFRAGMYSACAGLIAGGIAVGFAIYRRWTSMRSCGNNIRDYYQCFGNTKTSAICYQSEETICYQSEETGRRPDALDKNMLVLFDGVHSIQKTILPADLNQEEYQIYRMDSNTNTHPDILHNVLDEDAFSSIAPQSIDVVVFTMCSCCTKEVGLGLSSMLRNLKTVLKPNARLFMRIKSAIPARYIDESDFITEGFVVKKLEDGGRTYSEFMISNTDDDGGDDDDGDNEIVCMAVDPVEGIDTVYQECMVGSRGQSPPTEDTGEEDTGVIVSDYFKSGNVFLSLSKSTKK